MKQQVINNNPTQPAGKVYIVREDESLSIIAREAYGNPSLWPRIYEANRDRIENPNYIHPGQEIIIPDLKK